MRRVLFIAQSYPSVRSPNVLCDDMIIQRLLVTREAEIHCLCMRYYGQPLEEEVGGVHVHRFQVGPYFEASDRALRKPGTTKERLVRALNRVLLRADQVLTAPIYPCYHPLRVWQFVKQAESLQRRYSFDIVACEHFGYETMMAGLRLKEVHPEIRYIQFFWDALSGGTRPGYLPKAFIDRKRSRLERRVVGAADCSVAMLSHREHLMEMDYALKADAEGRLCFKGVPYLQEIVPIGKDSVIDFEPDRINVVFAGNLWGRNLEYIVSVLSRVRIADVTLWVITSSGTGGLKAKLAPYEDMVKFVPFLEHEELIGVLANADVLLNMGVKNPNAISGKIFEYMGCCKPIVSTYSIDNEACLPILGRYPNSLLLDERDPDLEAAARRVEDFLVCSTGRKIKYADIESAFYDCTPDSYCDLFDLPLKQGWHRG